MRQNQTERPSQAGPVGTNQKIELPKGSPLVANQKIEPPKGSVLVSNQKIELPRGSVLVSNQKIELPRGGQVGRDLPDEPPKAGASVANQKIELPKGSVLVSNQKIELPKLVFLVWTSSDGPRRATQCGHDLWHEGCCANARTSPPQGVRFLTGVREAAAPTSAPAGPPSQRVPSRRAPDR
jgi:hypothetical protein